MREKTGRPPKRRRVEEEQGGMKTGTEYIDNPAALNEEALQGLLRENEGSRLENEFWSVDFTLSLEDSFAWPAAGDPPQELN